MNSVTMYLEMLVTLTIHRDRISMMTGYVTKKTISVNHRLKVVMPVAMTSKGDRMQMMMNSVTMKMEMLVTVPIQTDIISVMTTSVT